MTFDQWIDAVNADLKTRLGTTVRTEELSWDSALWVGRSGTAAASLADDERTAHFSFDGGDKLAVRYDETAAAPAIVGGMIAKHIG